MKAKPDDLLHKLATGEDRVAKAKTVKAVLEYAGYRCKIIRRKMAKGHKIYFTIESKQPMDNLFTNNHQTIIRRAIREEFPNSVMTSGGGSSMTFAEY